MLLQKVLICSFFLFFNVLFLSAQRVVPIAARKLENDYINEFNKKLSPQIKLYNGTYDKGYPGRLIGNAYLNDSLSMNNGTIIYDGVEFSNVPMTLDLVKDKVVIQLYDGYSRLALISDKVLSFALHGKNFINLYSGVTGYPRRGFFETIYKGKLEVLVKRIKNSKEVINSLSLETEFNSRIEYFLLKDNVLYKTGSEDDIFKLFINDKSTLKRYLKDKNLKFRRNPIEVLVSIAKFYDQPEK